MLCKQKATSQNTNCTAICIYFQCALRKVLITSSNPYISSKTTIIYYSSILYVGTHLSTYCDYTNFASEIYSSRIYSVAPLIPTSCRIQQTQYHFQDTETYTAINLQHKMQLHTFSSKFPPFLQNPCITSFHKEYFQIYLSKLSKVWCIFLPGWLTIMKKIHYRRRETKRKKNISRCEKKRENVKVGVRRVKNIEERRKHAKASL